MQKVRKSDASGEASDHFLKVQILDSKTGIFLNEVKEFFLVCRLNRVISLFIGDKDSLITEPGDGRIGN